MNQVATSPPGAQRSTVAIITSVHEPFDPRIFHKQARSLAEAGYRVILLAPYAGTATVEGVHVVGVPPPRTRLGRPLVWPRLLRRALRVRADAYHVHDPELLPLGLLLGLLTGRPVVYDAHEYYRDEIALRPWLPRPLRRLAAETVHAVETFAVRHLAATVAVNEHMAAGFRRRGARHVVTLHNYPRLAGFGADTGSRPRHVEGLRERGAGSGAGLGEAGFRAEVLPGGKDPPVSPLLAQGGSGTPLPGSGDAEPSCPSTGQVASPPSPWVSSGTLSSTPSTEGNQRNPDTGPEVSPLSVPEPVPMRSGKGSGVRSPAPILYLGLLNRERGLAVIWEASRLLRAGVPEATVTLIGRIDWGGAPANVPRGPARWQQEAGVVLGGVIPAARVPQVLATAAIGWIPFQPTPNNAHAIPLKLLEYMAAGLPVVASGFGMMAGIVRATGCGLLVPAADPAAHAEALAHLLNHPDEARERGARGRRAVRERYTWEAEQVKLLDMYRDLVEAAHPRR